MSYASLIAFFVNKQVGHLNIILQTVSKHIDKPREVFPLVAFSTAIPCKKASAQGIQNTRKHINFYFSAQQSYKPYLYLYL